MGIEQARWIQGKHTTESPIFRKHFEAFGTEKAELCICGLGWFELYVNGNQVTDAVYEPAVSVYEGIEGKRLLYPLKDRFSHARIYYCKYDVSKWIREGKNVLSVHLGNGWYNQHRRTIEGDFFLGLPCLAFSLQLTGTDGKVTEVKSDRTTLVGESDIIDNNLFYGEIHDLSKKQEFHSVDFDDCGFEPSVECQKPTGELTLYEYPSERVIRTIIPKCIGQCGEKKIYDLGENITGRLKFDTVSGFFGDVVIQHAEELKEDGSLDFSTAGGEEQIQAFTVICDGKEQENICPHFSWQAFRYFSVQGRISNVCCEVIHTDIKQTGFFHCEDEMLNRILDMYIRTQLNNIHGCVPLDCPHRERLGYTGDGQISCETVMHVFDAKLMYKKWMQDIVDCQNAENGHIQHSAPFYGGGGGPAGWGGVAIVLPYTYWKVYGSSELVEHHLHSMKQYLSYMESRCENGLVVKEEPDGWCLGDWCFIDDNINERYLLTPEFVNTSYLVKFYDMMLELQEKLGLELDRQEYEKRRKHHAQAIIDTYYDDITGDFCKDAFAANAYAIDIGLGDQRTLEHLAERYEKIGGFDTGIFGTEILMRVLCENGYTELAYRLLVSTKEKQSFGYMAECGATTLWERWDGIDSHNHPMFGGCMKILWTALLGIQNLEAGYRTVLIQPCDLEALGDIKGSMETAIGTISVSVERTGKQVEIVIEIPENMNATLKFRGQEFLLQQDKNIYCFE